MIDPPWVSRSTRNGPHIKSIFWNLQDVRLTTLKGSICFLAGICVALHSLPFCLNFFAVSTDSVRKRCGWKLGSSLARRFGHSLPKMRKGTIMYCNNTIKKYPIVHTQGTQKLAAGKYQISLKSKLPHLASILDGHFVARYRIWEWPGNIKSRWIWRPSNIKARWIWWPSRFELDGDTTI